MLLWLTLTIFSALNVVMITVDGHVLLPNHPYIRNNASNSPCPGLNTLANHGFIPRDGKNINRHVLIQALVNVYHLSETMAKTLTDKAFSLCSIYSNSDKDNDFGFDLDCLSQSSKSNPNAIEHDVSLTRLDCPNHDCLHPNPDRIDDLLKFATLNDSLSVSDIIDFRRHIECDISRLEDGFSFPLKARSIAAAEAAILTSVLGHFGPIPLIYLKPFLLEERLPMEEGWQRPGSEIGFSSFKFEKVLAQYVWAETTRRCP